LAVLVHPVADCAATLLFLTEYRRAKALSLIHLSEYRPTVICFTALEMPSSDGRSQMPVCNFYQRAKFPT
jgi:hypothetical protein